MQLEAHSPSPETAVSAPLVGLDRISFSVPSHVLPLEALAAVRGTPFRKYAVGLGQEQMAVPAPDEDIITMAANAGSQVLAGEDLSTIEAVILATESGIDQSKAGSIFVHRLLGLPSGCRAFEVKQACCSSTAALQMALDAVTLRHGKKVLVIATDVARYGLETAGEPTQGAGAVAMLVSANPRLMAIDAENGSYTEDVNDFWRPNYLDTAIVDGKFSIRVYLRAMMESVADYRQKTGRALSSFDRFCYHLPFTRMGEKAHHHLWQHSEEETPDEAIAQIQPGTVYNRRVGNTYTASLHLCLLSLLENDPADLSGARIGLFSYGSGCMGTFFTGQVQAGYRDALLTDLHRDLLDRRTPIDMARYEAWYTQKLPEDGQAFATATATSGKFRLAGVDGHARIYERNERHSQTGLSQGAVQVDLQENAAAESVIEHSPLTKV